MELLFAEGIWEIPRPFQHAALKQGPEEKFKFLKGIYLQGDRAWDTSEENGDPCSKICAPTLL